MYTLNEAAKEIGIQVRTIREWLRKGKVNAEQNGHNRRWLVPDEEVERLKAEYENKN